MNKSLVLEEIKRTAQSNGGNPLGRQRFREETGIKEHEWGKFWRSWGEALTEAGFAPNEFQAALDKSNLLTALADFSHELGRLPTNGDLRVRNAASDFPSPKTFSARFGSKSELVEQLAEFCRTSAKYDDVLQMCEQYSPPRRKKADETDHRDDVEFGYVYLMKSGRHFKIGKTNATGRRERELAIQLPEKAKTIHVISTDDPTGIEAYWHNRFQAKRLNGEWFDLSASDVSAFKRRKFM